MKNNIHLEEETFKNYLKSLDTNPYIRLSKKEKSILWKRYERLNNEFIITQEVVDKISQLNTQLRNFELELLEEAKRWSNFIKSQDNFLKNDIRQIELKIEVYLKVGNKLFTACMPSEDVIDLSNDNWEEETAWLSEIQDWKDGWEPIEFAAIPFCYTMHNLIGLGHNTYLCWKDIFEIENINGSLECARTKFVKLGNKRFE